MKIYLLTFLSILLFIVGKSQSTSDSTSTLKALLNSVEPYGTFEYALAGSRRGWAVKDIVPRMGLNGQWKFDNNPNYYFFTKAEVGLHLTRRNDYVSISADPGAPSATAESALFARQGFIGIGTPYGRISIGKMWGVHYNLAGFLDNMYIFGGDAIGVYNAGTDGGASGTGRADQAMKYELYNGNFFIGIQGQFRNISDNTRTGADAAGFATTYKIGNFITGISFYQVFDGVEKPTIGEAKIGDKMGSFLIDFNKGNFHFGVQTMIFNAHEKNNEGDFYDGWAVEYNLKYNFGKKKVWSIVNNSSIMMPFNTLNSKYIMNRYAIELARRFSINTVLIIGVRYDNTTLVNGKPEELLTTALGFYYNFNYPVP